jgi:hypothetical protein
MPIEILRARERRENRDEGEMREREGEREGETGRYRRTDRQTDRDETDERVSFGLRTETLYPVAN